MSRVWARQSGPPAPCHADDPPVAGTSFGPKGPATSSLAFGSNDRENLTAQQAARQARQNNRNPLPHHFSHRTYLSHHRTPQQAGGRRSRPKADSSEARI